MDPEQYARQLRKPEGADALATTLRMEQLNSRFYTQATTRIPESGNLTLLEIGPGSGAHALPWLKENPTLHYHALDYSTDVLAICQVRLKERRTQTRFTAGDARNPELYEPDSCDVILSVNTIYFMDDLEALFRLWFQSLKPSNQPNITLLFRIRQTLLACSLNSTASANVFMLVASIYQQPEGSKLKTGTS
jgi:ubiquinone/menaquinone biosynthesis C-methylase UbiE